ncbi:hypothetical protein MIZ03_1213 [Rhodoferax lithotrophicus]|uniref:Uncharacterized protein n=1 Tax=Rhodoferax lithotrophicus TaxID=2798804 RepID=A0ABN6D8P2_9BURK|nr:hypothetical protein MIZ03_1213 [Rhodoferax sp. MIZ03]
MARFSSTPHPLRAALCPAHQKSESYWPQVQANKAQTAI